MSDSSSDHEHLKALWQGQPQETDPMSLDHIQAISRRYHVSFHFEAVRPWHRRSLDVLTELGGGIVSVNPKDGEAAKESADEAKEYGLVDNVITHRGEIVEPSTLAAVTK